MLIPYVEVPLKNADGQLPLYCVRVGPAIDPLRAVDSVRLLLEISKQHVQKGIGKSVIPYRTW